MDVIAERHFLLHTDQEPIPVIAKIGRPEPGPAGEDWVCPFEVHFGDRCKSMAMHGIDSMQALQLTIATLDMELHYGATKRGGTLYHYEEPFVSIVDHGGLEVRKA